MYRIVATGIYQGNQKQLEVSDTLIVTSKGEPEEYIQSKFKEFIKTPHNLAGSYSPKPNSMLAALSVFERDIFDNMPSISVEGDMDIMPHEEGIIY